MIFNAAGAAVTIISHKLWSRIMNTSASASNNNNSQRHLSQPPVRSNSRLNHHLDLPN